MNIETDSLIQTYDHLKQLVAEEEQVILYFSSQDCNVCHTIFSKFMNLVKDHSIKVIKIDINEHVEIAGQLSVFTYQQFL